MSKKSRNSNDIPLQDLISKPVTVSAKGLILSREEEKEEPVIKLTTPESYVALADPILEFMLNSNGFNSKFVALNIFYYLLETQLVTVPVDVPVTVPVDVPVTVPKPISFFEDESVPEPIPEPITEPKTITVSKIVEVLHNDKLYVLKIILNDSFDLNGNKGVFYFYFKDLKKTKYLNKELINKEIKIMSIDSKSEYVIIMDFDIFKRYVKDPKTFPDYVKTKKITEYENILFIHLCYNYFIKSEHILKIEKIKGFKEEYLDLYSKKGTKYTDIEGNEQTRLDNYIKFYDKQEYLDFLINSYFFFLEKKYKKYKSYLKPKTKMKIKIKYLRNTDIYDINITFDKEFILIIVLKKDGIETTVLGFKDSRNPNHIYVPRYNLYILVEKTPIFIIQYDKNNLKLLHRFEYKILFEYNISVTNIEQYIIAFEKDVTYLFFKLLFGNIIKDVEVLADVPIQKAKKLDSNSYNSKDLKLIDFNIARAMKDSKQKDVKTTSKIPSLVSNFSTTSDVKSPPSIQFKKGLKDRLKTMKTTASEMFATITRKNTRKARRNTVVPE